MGTAVCPAASRTAELPDARALSSALSRFPRTCHASQGVPLRGSRNAVTAGDIALGARPLLVGPHLSERAHLRACPSPCLRARTSCCVPSNDVPVGPGQRARTRLQQTRRVLGVTPLSQEQQRPAERVPGLSRPVSGSGGVRVTVRPGAARWTSANRTPAAEKHRVRRSVRSTGTRVGTHAEQTLTGL